ncbi:MAG: diaminohydroxyphosphoribosylaminopyrimidine deaminase [Actinomycetota bacterium]|nr:diaminohydroxyphosphoribosylaminopyrimidine deaminase [Actinomycetota bacterium]
MTLSDVEQAALERAFELARNSGVVHGPNPAVGAVLLAPDGTVVAEGWHEGAGTAHAEAVALAAAGQNARGATAVVSLEPCAHHGRTPPCAHALSRAGVARVVFGQRDPNPAAAGGAEVLRGAGVDVSGPHRADEARAINEEWSMAAERGRPVVTWKVAASLDGRISAADGTSQWITSAQSREAAHQLRVASDAVLTGTGTALLDRPRLTARPGGQEAPRQPLRAVMGLTPLPAGHPLTDAMLLRTRDPQEALHLLWQADVRRVMLECGPRLAGAFLDADLVDRVVWFTAPIMLGPYGLAVADGGPTTLADAVTWQVVKCGRSGVDIRLDLVRREQ